ncbi:MAG: chemotaxis-specific protein-glutamate methyltransferase CheB [Pseudomonadota bacterium]
MRAAQIDRPVKVLIVDDTRTIRAMIRSVLDGDPRFDVVGEAEDPYVARDMIKSLNPDVLTLDVEMPRMNGLVFLRNLMRLRPMPVLMVSTRTSEQSEEAVTALSLGAVDCIDLKRVHGAPDIRVKLTETLMAAARAQLRKSGEEVRPQAQSRGPSFQWTGQKIVIGSSTGGVDALERLFRHFPANCPPTFVAQHMPESFLASFVRRLDGSVAPDVRLATAGAEAKQGTIYFAPGGSHHLEVTSGARTMCRLREDEGDQLYVPSVDLLFRSAVPTAKETVAIMLTGMGRDGAEAMLELRNGGARTVVQDAESAVIDGMPGAARAVGAAEIVAHLDRIAEKALALCGKMEGAAA